MHTIAIAALGALLLAGPLGAQLHHFTEQPYVFHVGIGSSQSPQGALNRAIVAEGFAPLGETTSSHSIGLMLPMGGWLLAIERQGERQRPAYGDGGREVRLVSHGTLVYVAPPVGAQRTYVYPVMGVGMFAHTLEVMTPQVVPRAPGDALDGMPQWLHETRTVENGGSLALDLGLGSHHLLTTPTARWGLVIGVRMGWLLASSQSHWIADGAEAYGPPVRPGGPYGRVSIGTSYLPARRHREAK